jgi:hypothetical protein
LNSDDPSAKRGVIIIPEAAEAMLNFICFSKTNANITRFVEDVFVAASKFKIGGLLVSQNVLFLYEFDFRVSAFLLSIALSLEPMCSIVS